MKSNFNTLDFERESLNKIILTSDYPCLIALSGGTLPNLENADIVLKNIARSMKDTDLLAISFSLDNEVSRGILQYMNNVLNNNHTNWFFEMLGIDTSICEIELRYTENGCRQKSIKLDKDYKINFNVNGTKKQILLRKNQKLTSWRHYLLTEIDFLSLINSAGLRLHNLTVDKNTWSALALCKIKESPALTKLGV